MELKAVTYRDGTYSWTGTVDDAYREKAFRKAVRLSALGYCIPMALITFLLPKNAAYWYTAAFFTALFLLVLGINWAWQRGTAGGFENYIMTDKYIQAGSERHGKSVCFKDVHYLEGEKDRIVFRTRFGRMTVFIPESDYAVLREIIEKRIQDQGRY